MKMLGARVGAAVLVALTLGGIASADNLQEDRAWQFRSASDKAALQNDVVLMQQKQNGYYKLYKNGFGAGGGVGSGGGLLGSSAQSTNNFTQIINQTTNNCSASVAGAALTCSATSTASGNTVAQTTTGSTNSSQTTTSGNEVTNAPMTNSGNSGNTGATFGTGK